MTTAVDVRIEPFQKSDKEGNIYDFNRVIAEIEVDDKMVWTKTVLTNDVAGSVWSVYDELGVEAIQCAAADYGYEYSKEEAESFGLLVTST